jgi:hypothetical protein
MKAQLMKEYHIIKGKQGREDKNIVIPNEVKNLKDLKILRCALG